MTRFRLTVEFDGRPFMGWQRQAHGPSVQQAIEEAVKAITGEDAAVHAAGRTDAGVHAEAMAAHVEITRPFTAFRLMDAINAKLRPHPIAI
ncbi:MAG: tRNA pseudouridine(38-40) synthase TruA, partial [Sphingomonadaceae bacterium]|nr:tRNA pseudouridine(38-40) synthase TruA [Sphingomonadaceae bacterium]